jgi:predicted transcriptional regulator of viral defense system
VRVKQEEPTRASNFISELATRGRYSFTSTEAGLRLGTSKDATKLALNRLIKQGAVASPGRGFYIIVPPEYRALGSLPADQFIPALMAHHGQPYYAGLLTAAQYYGAAHHRPQEFQVVTAPARRPIEVGSVRVAFFLRKNIAEIATEDLNTPRGTLRVSSPEATALDLVGYQERIGGLEQVATVLADLADKIDPDKLASAAEASPVPWAQRLGYLLERVEAYDKAKSLKAYVGNHARDVTRLLPSASTGAVERNADWKLDVNASVEPEL